MASDCAILVRPDDGYLDMVEYALHRRVGPAHGDARPTDASEAIAERLGDVEREGFDEKAPPSVNDLLYFEESQAIVDCFLDRTHLDPIVQPDLQFRVEIEALSLSSSSNMPWRAKKQFFIRMTYTGSPIATSDRRSPMGASDSIPPCSPSAPITT